MRLYATCLPLTMHPYAATLPLPSTPHGDNTMPILYANKRPFSHIDEPRQPFVAPPGFPELTYTPKNDLFVPITRSNQQQPDFSQNAKNQNFKFPIHKPNTPTYNLLCTLDKMRVGDHIEIPGLDCYSYAYSQASLYAARIRRTKKTYMPFRFRGYYDVAHNIGRIWRIA